MPSFNDLVFYDSPESIAARASDPERKEETLESLRVDVNLIAQTLALMLIRLEEVEKACRAKKV